MGKQIVFLPLEDISMTISSQVRLVTFVFFYHSNPVKESTKSGSIRIVLNSPLTDLVATLQQQHSDIKFDWVLGRNALGEEVDKELVVQQLSQVLAEQGQIILVERLPQQGQRLYQWVSGVDADLMERWQAAEEAIYDHETGDELLNWRVQDWMDLWQNAGFKVNTELESVTQNIYVTVQLLDRWFAVGGSGLSYADRLRQSLDEKEVEMVRSIMTQQLLHQTMIWKSFSIFISTEGRRKI
jgi:putative ATPase